MPGSHHLPGASPKEQRQYEHIKQSYIDAGKEVDKAKEIAAKTVNANKVIGEDHMDKHNS